MKAKRQTKQISSHVRLILEAPFFSLVEISQQLEAGQDVLRLAVGSVSSRNWPLPMIMGTDSLVFHSLPLATPSTLANRTTTMAHGSPAACHRGPSPPAAAPPRRPPLRARVSGARASVGGEGVEARCHHHWHAGGGEGAAAGSAGGNGSSTIDM